MPVPVPPLMTMFSRARTARSSSSACAGRTLPSVDHRGDRAARPARTCGWSAAARRPPAAATPRSPGCRRAGGRRPSGSTRRRAGRPPDDAVDDVAQVRLVLEPHRLLAQQPSRSAYTRSGPFTITSVTVGSRTSASSGPTPAASSATAAVSRSSSPGASGKPVAADQVERDRLHRSPQIAVEPGPAEQLLAHQLPVAGDQRRQVALIRQADPQAAEIPAEPAAPDRRHQRPSC